MSSDDAAVERLVLDVHRQVREEGALSNEALARALRRSALADTDRRRAARCLRDLLSRYRWIDFLLADVPVSRGRRGEVQRFVVSEWAAGRIQADYAGARLPEWDLRAVEARVAAVDRLPRVERIAVRFSLPDWAAATLVAEAGEAAEAVAEALDQAAPRIVRANTLLGPRDALAARLAAAGLENEPTPFASTGLRLEPFADVFHTDAFREHLFEVQDESSQLCVEAVAVPPGGFVLDACAGAGSKTLGLAAALKGRGRVLALDVHEGKVKDLRLRARRAGAHQVEARCTAETGWDEAAATFARRADRILLDVPCSGLGVFRRRPEMRWKIGPPELERLAGVQRDLLLRAGAALAPGARLVYATCTLRREENEDQVAFVREAYPDLELVRLAEIWGAERARPLTDPTGTFLKLRPDLHATDGFFVAVLRRGKRRDPAVAPLTPPNEISP